MNPSEAIDATERALSLPSSFWAGIAVTLIAVAALGVFVWFQTRGNAAPSPSDSIPELPPVPCTKPCAEAKETLRVVREVADRLEDSNRVPVVAILLRIEKTIESHAKDEEGRGEVMREVLVAIKTLIALERDLRARGTDR